MSEFLVIGRIAAPRGVRGELKVDLETSFPERFLVLERVFVGDKHIQYQVDSARLHSGRALLLLRGVDDRDKASALRNQYVYVPIEEAVPLEDGEFYYHELEGLQVVDTQGHVLGELVEVLPTGANDVYIVRGSKGELLIPATREVILEIDLRAERMVVELPDGLLDG